VRKRTTAAALRKYVGAKLTTTCVDNLIAPVSIIDCPELVNNSCNSHLRADNGDSPAALCPREPSRTPRAHGR